MFQAACGGGGLYNYAQEYAPLRSERAHYAAETSVSYEDIKRDPNGFKSAEVGWFGVVKALEELSEGRTRVSLSLRAHQERHLCSDRNESSCRVTVSERDLGTFSTDLVLGMGEKAGKDRVWVGSLLKIYGHPSGDYDAEGGPILNATFHRHWPRGTYVTTAQRGAMRR